jgi:hypothetical protein
MRPMATAPPAASVVRAVSLAAPVAALLRSPAGRRGSVALVHASAVTVELDDELITVARCRTGGLPTGILVDDGFEPRVLGIRPGDDVALGPWSIRLAGIVVDLRSADTWSPVLPRHGRPMDTAERASALRSATSEADPRAHRRDAGSDPVAAHVAHRRGMLRDALAHGDEAAVVAAGRGLIGLGPGLTPSGDDVLVGLGAVLAATGDPLAVRVTPRWAAAAPGRTTGVAVAFHRSAARGQFAERIHDLVGILLDGEVSDIPAAVVRAASWGATSGFDLLDGMAIGLDRVGAVTHAAARSAARPTTA